MGDYSINSSIHKSVASKGTIKESAEESGWTAYFEDLSNNDHQPNSYYSSFNCSSSLISDAGTTTAAARKISHNKNHVFACSNSTFPGSSKIPKKLRFKKTRTKEICEDDSLEDTASSPVNSPKEKETASKNYSEIQIEEENKMNFDHGIKNDCRELKKKGLCLVPLSMLVNYLG